MFSSPDNQLLWNQFLGKLFVFSSIFTFLCCCKVFCGEPIQQPVPSASHHSTSIRPRVREYQRGAGKTTMCAKYAYYHQKKVYKPARYVSIVLGLLQSIGLNRMLPRLGFLIIEGMKVSYLSISFLLTCF
ncbi:unnamed protein product [Brassica rapa]|uniref:Uncharacterized protein n=2 Tax=Brassica TaxID=3705 RepID=A0A8D9MCY0_BRACM|nr:unnamed protein product [Brassica napus]CAG7905817.1 unnamed protein product [Brassica rapa]